MSSPIDKTSFDFFKTQGYKYGLFNCFGDLPICLAVTCCGTPLVIGYAMGQVKGNTFDIGSCCCGVSAYRLRKHVQNTYGIKETDDASMCAVSCCGCCTTIQDVAELRARGALGGAGAKTVQPTAAQMEAPQ